MLSVNGSESLLSSLNPVSSTLVVMLMALFPFFLLGATSFVKLSVVFQILRNAIGAQQVPSGALIALLSFALTMHIMAPVLNEAKSNMEEALVQQKQIATSKSKKSEISLDQLIEISKVVALPFEKFLQTHSDHRERSFFASLGSKLHGSKEAMEQSELEFANESIFSLLPAFILCELRDAFLIGFLVFLPFLVVDLVIANLLVGLGMMMVSPVTVSLPFKIILFVLCDGWYILSAALIASYSVV